MSSGRSKSCISFKKLDSSESFCYIMYIKSNSERYNLELIEEKLNNPETLAKLEEEFDNLDFEGGNSMKNKDFHFGRK